MAKPLDPKAIEAERQTSSRAERREQKRRQMQNEISYNQRGNGVIIPPQKRRELAEEPSKLRVAAYCRVSTQEEQQVGSFDMQIHHFTKRIEANPQWELVEIYQDEGISATTVEKRLGFQEMITDAVDGKIDLILTKSISRFGRNIVDILDNLQTLSALNPPVSVEFETEGITYTGDGRNNLLISLLAALAEIESQQKSVPLETNCCSQNSRTRTAYWSGGISLGMVSTHRLASWEFHCFSTASAAFHKVLRSAYDRGAFAGSRISLWTIPRFSG